MLHHLPCSHLHHATCLLVYLSLHIKHARAEFALTWHMYALQCLFMVILPVSCPYTVMLKHFLRLLQVCTKLTLSAYDGVVP